MDDDMATPIDQLPGPQPQQMQVPTTQQAQDLLETRPSRVTFDENPVEIPNVSMDIKKRDSEEGTEKFSFKSLLSKKTLYESVFLVALYVLLGQPFVVYRLGNLLGSRFGTNITVQLVLRGLLLVVGYYVLSIFVLPKLN